MPSVCFVSVCFHSNYLEFYSNLIIKKLCIHLLKIHNYVKRGMVGGQGQEWGEVKLLTKLLIAKYQSQGTYVTLSNNSYLLAGQYVPSHYYIYSSNIYITNQSKLFFLIAIITKMENSIPIFPPLAVDLNNQISFHPHLTRTKFFSTFLFQRFCYF